VKVLVIGGHTRNIGKTSLAASIIAATREIDWTALKVTQYGHHICSTSGHTCGCVVEDPEHPFAITPELDATSGTDTARFLQAGAREVYWVRTRSGDLDQAMPDLRKLLDGRGFVLMESNSILRFLQPDIYLSVLQYDVVDFKLSSRLYLNRADAFVVVGSRPKPPDWPGIGLEIIRERPVFSVEPPEFANAELLAFVRERIGVEEPVPPRARRLRRDAPRQATTVVATLEKKG
jgi:hypothetical protein